MRRSTGKCCLGLRTCDAHLKLQDKGVHQLVHCQISQSAALPGNAERGRSRLDSSLCHCLKLLQLAGDLLQLLQ